MGTPIYRNLPLELDRRLSELKKRRCFCNCNTPLMFLESAAAKTGNQQILLSRSDWKPVGGNQRFLNGADFPKWVALALLLKQRHTCCLVTDQTETGFGATKCYIEQLNVSLLRELVCAPKVNASGLQSLESHHSLDANTVWFPELFWRPLGTSWQRVFC